MSFLEWNSIMVFLGGAYGVFMWIFHKHEMDPPVTKAFFAPHICMMSLV